MTLAAGLTLGDTSVNVCRMTQDATQNTTPGAAQGTAPGSTRKQGWTAERIPDQTGRVAVVTGATAVWAWRPPARSPTGAAT